MFNNNMLFLAIVFFFGLHALAVVPNFSIHNKSKNEICIELITIEGTVQRSLTPGATCVKVGDFYNHTVDERKKTALLIRDKNKKFLYGATFPLGKTIYVNWDNAHSPKLYHQRGPRMGLKRVTDLGFSTSNNIGDEEITEIREPASAPPPPAKTVTQTKTAPTPAKPAPTAPTSRNLPTPPKTATASQGSPEGITIIMPEFPKAGGKHSDAFYEVKTDKPFKNIEFPAARLKLLHEQFDPDQSELRKLGKFDLVEFYFKGKPYYAFLFDTKEAALNFHNGIYPIIGKFRNAFKDLEELPNLESTIYLEGDKRWGIAMVPESLEWDAALKESLVKRARRNAQS